MSDNLPPLPDELLQAWARSDKFSFVTEAVQAYAREAVRIAKAEKGLEPVAPEAPIHLDHNEACAWQSGWESGYKAHPPTQVEPVPDYSEAEFAASALRDLDWLDKPLLNGVADLLLRQAYAIAHPPTSDWNAAIEAAATLVWNNGEDVLPVATAIRALKRKPR